MDMEHDDIENLVNKYENYKHLNKQYLNVKQFQKIAEYYLTLGKLKKSLEVIITAKEIYPSSDQLTITESQILIELGYYKAAERRLKYLSDTYPNDPEINILLGITLAKLGIVSDAIDIFDNITHQIHKKNKPLFFYEVAQTFIQISRFDIAQKYLVKAYNCDNKNSKVILDLAYCYDKNLQYEQSAFLYKKYLKYNPFSKLAWHNLALVYEKLGNKNNALEAFDFALAIDPKFVPSLFNKAIILYESKQYKKALENFKKIIELEPDNITVKYFISQIYLKNKKYNYALKYLKELAIREENFADVWYSLSQIYLWLGDKQKAKKMLKKALNIDKQNYKYWALATNLFHNLDLRQINKIFKKIINYNPYNPEYWTEHSKILIKNGKFSQAVKVLKKGLYYLKSDINIMLNLGYLFLKSGQNQMAKKYFQKIIEINPLVANKIKKLYPLD